MVHTKYNKTVEDLFNEELINKILVPIEFVESILYDEIRANNQNYKIQV